MGPLVYSTQLLYTTTHTTTLQDERPPFRPPAGVTAGDQLPKANTKRASSCSFCDKIVVAHTLYREELSDECAGRYYCTKEGAVLIAYVLFHAPRVQYVGQCPLPPKADIRRRG
jgi:hypothetical protein